MPSPTSPSPDKPPPSTTDHLRPPSRRSSGQPSHHQPKEQPPPPSPPAATSTPAMALPSSGHLRPAMPPADSPPDIRALPEHPKMIKAWKLIEACQHKISKEELEWKKKVEAVNIKADLLVEEEVLMEVEEEETHGQGFLAIDGSFGKTMPFELIQSWKQIEARKHELFKAKLRWKKIAAAKNIKTDLLVGEEALMEEEEEEEETPEAGVDPDAPGKVLNADVIDQPENQPEKWPAVKESPAAATSGVLAGGRVQLNRAGHPIPNVIGRLVTSITPITSNQAVTDKTSINRSDIIPAGISNLNSNSPAGISNLNSNSPAKISNLNSDSPAEISNLNSNSPAKVSNSNSDSPAIGSSKLPIPEHSQPPAPPATTTKPWASLLQSKARMALQFVKPDLNSKGTLTLGEGSSSEGEALWKTTVIGYALERRLPFKLLQNKIMARWACYGLKEVRATKNGFLFLTFKTLEGVNKVLDDGPWIFFGQEIFLKKWERNFDFRKDEFKTIRNWVKLFGVPTTYWSTKGLNAIASRIGRQDAFF